MFEGEGSSFEASPPEESGNRTFLVAAGILGGIVLLSIACLAAYALIFLPRQQQAAAADIALTQNAQRIVAALTATAQAFVQPTATLTPTPVLAQPTATMTPQGTSTSDPATATVGAALTQAAIAQLTVVPTSTALPGTGLGEEYGAPGLVAMALALVAVVILARRLRTAPIRNK
jgi:hypothetical protein